MLYLAVQVCTVDRRMYGILGRSRSETRIYDAFDVLINALYIRSLCVFSTLKFPLGHDGRNSTEGRFKTHFNPELSASLACLCRLNSDNSLQWQISDNTCTASICLR